MFSFSRLFTCAAFAMAAVPASQAAVYLDFITPFGAGTPVVVNPGDTFSVDVSVRSTGDEMLGGVTLFLTTTGSGLFTLTGRDFAGSLFSDPITSNATLLNAANAILDPENEKDVGAVVDSDPITGTALFVASLQFTVKADAPQGMYSISPIVSGGKGAIWVDPDFNGVAFDGWNSVNVSIVPEPATYAFAAGALAMVAIYIKRRRA